MMFVKGNSGAFDSGHIVHFTVGAVKTAWSELAGPLARPTFHNNFFVGEELDGVAALRVHHAEEAALPSREGKVGHRCRDADIDSDVARGDSVAKFARGGAGSGENRTGVSVRRALNHADSFFDRTGVDDREDGPEDF